LIRNDEPSYAEALRTLQDRGRFGIRLGLGRTRAILRELGDPQLGFRGALVTGTNGKGSVLALAGSALRAAGYRIGSTPKPHLVSYRERLQIDGRPVDPGTFARLVARVDAVAVKVGRRLGEPTEFELLTAVVFLWFAEQGIDLALVEVGLGGRLDATHAWDGGVAVITNVDLDHMDRLGPTIRHIAREKAAIIVRGDLAVTGTTGDALAIVRRRSRRLAVPLSEVVAPPILGWDRDGLTGRAWRARADPDRASRPPPGRECRGRGRDTRCAGGGRDRHGRGGGAAGRVRDSGVARAPRAAIGRRPRRAP
jgi:dihydrofolate synthase/folylpolyglutamate synthase